jgi:hypothetical protein
MLLTIESVVMRLPIGIELSRRPMLMNRLKERRLTPGEVMEFPRGIKIRKINYYEMYGIRYNPTVLFSLIYNHVYKFMRMHQIGNFKWLTR